LDVSGKIDFISRFKN